VISLFPYLSLGLATAADTASPQRRLAHGIVAWEDGAIIEKVPKKYLSEYTASFQHRGFPGCLGADISNIVSADGVIFYRSEARNFLLYRVDSRYTFEPTAFQVEQEKRADPFIGSDIAVNRVLWFLLKHLKAKVECPGPVSSSTTSIGSKWEDLGSLYIPASNWYQMGLPDVFTYEFFNFIENFWKIGATAGLLANPHAFSKVSIPEYIRYNLQCSQRRDYLGRSDLNTVQRIRLSDIMSVFSLK
jgi:hypothetical protein